MSLASDYKRQWAWREWPSVFAMLPSIEGKTVLDLGCGVGDQAAEFVARGARVIGLDTNEELLGEAQSRRLPRAEFRHVDLRTLDDVEVIADGLWCSFAAAYFPDLQAALALWEMNLAPGGWIALTEIDDLFGHRPLAPRTRELLQGYAEASLRASRYDFHMGRRLQDHLERSGFVVGKRLTVGDQELSFDGPAPTDVLDAWRTRLDRMKLLQEFCGAEFEPVREDFLGCLVRDDHRSQAQVYCCIASKGGERR
jgi:SAM-dependent methyltransferase